MAHPGPVAPLLVTGGTGTLGRAVIARLEAAGTDHRVLSRRTGPGHVVADLLTGAGVDDALRGVGTVINCATSPRHDVPAAQHLVQAARRQAVGHIVHISIVGIDRIPLPYYKEKLAVESMLAASGVPATILRATQFHDLVLAMFAGLARTGVLPVPAGTSVQPVDVRDVAGRLVDLSTAEPAGRVDDFGGPDVRSFGDLARTWLTATGRTRVIVPIWLPGRIARAYRNGAHLAPEHAAGVRSFADFVRAART